MFVCLIIDLFVDNFEHIEAKGFFEANFSHIYQILYESFVQAEQNLRQKGKFLNLLLIISCSWALVII